MRPVYILIALILFPLYGIAQKPFLRDITLGESNVTVNVNALAQDSTGYIWIGSSTGLLRYNGRNTVRIADTMQQPVTALACDGHSIWVGYKNGRTAIVTNDAVILRSIKGGPASAITTLCRASDGKLWAGTAEEGIFICDGDKCTVLNTANGLSDNFTYSLANTGNDMLAGTDMGINDIATGSSKPTVSTYTTRQGLPDNIVTTVKPIPGTPMCWIGTQESGVFLYDYRQKKTTTLLPAGSKWAYGQINDILPMAGKRAWAATEDGYLVEIIYNDTGASVMHPYYYAGKSFRKLLADRAGNIWCGTRQGLSMMTGEYLAYVRLAQPYSLQDITAMTWNNNILWLALNKDLYHISIPDTDGHMIKVYSAKSKITSLYSDKDGRLWIGTLGDGLYYQQSKYNVIRVTSIPEPDNDDNILTITGTGSRLWVAGLKGVNELSLPGAEQVRLVQHHGKRTGVGSDYVYQMYPDSKGNIWMATDGAGVCMYDGKAYHHWDTAFGANKVAYSITEDRAGSIWAAAMYKDLFYYHNNVWHNLRKPETQYPDVNISAVAANATGQIISVYQRCIDEWYPESSYFRHFNSALGIGLDSTSNVLNCTTRDGDGNIYAPFQKGVLIFRNQYGPYDITPAVHITAPTIFSRAAPAGKHSFEYDENYVGFTFDGISYANAERLNYRYMLEGYNDTWIYTRDLSVSFPRLAAGGYRFRVQVSLNPAFEHPAEDAFSFSIATPFWKTYWFYGSAALLLGIMGYLYVKRREKRLQRLSQLQQERMMFEYEHLKSQVNPHFLFNSLYALSILIEEKKENALSYTVHLADLYRNMLSSGRKNTVTLTEELEILNNYTSIQQTRFEDALHVHIDIPEDVRQGKQIIPLALQLLVENAIKHNVVSVSRPLNIYISATEHEITVRNVIQPKISREKSEGIGLENIKKRYGLLTRKHVTIGIFENEFIVILPLL